MNEPSEQCPNCSKWYPLQSCKYSSIGKISTENGVYSSTLYGVCKDCADVHQTYFESLNAAAISREAQR